MNEREREGGGIGRVRRKEWTRGREREGGKARDGEGGRDDV